MQLPSFTLCDSDAQLSLQSFADCTSPTARTYDKNTCALIGKNYCDSRNESKDWDYFIMASKEGTLNCDGPCPVINFDGDFYQTTITEAMRYTMDGNSSGFPFLLISDNDESVFHSKNINRFGDYHIVLEKTTYVRLPGPYNSPPCVVQGSQEALKKNILLGNYTVGKCRMSCYIKEILRLCGSIQLTFRAVLRDKTVLDKYFRDRSVDEMKMCFHNNYKEITEGPIRKKCVDECRSPCNEHVYKITQRYEPNPGAGTRVRLFFYFHSLKETVIEQVPRLDLPTLLANLGGQLGLMTGISVISVVELLLWFSLFVVDRTHFFYDRYIR